tara:strand:- start:302 stop:826 length:525 start_codon:yes stop_codon:yes gene_type:complete
LKKRIKKIGILGGTFDPCHQGHLAISKEAKKRFKLKKIIWVITKKNPFKKKSFSNLEERIINSKKYTNSYKYIKVDHLEKNIKSNRTFDLLKYLKKKLINTKLYLIIGADNLITFHKWYKWKSIQKMCTILVFDRYPYKYKALKSLAFKQIDNGEIIFIKFKKVNISSSQLRKI